MRDLSSPHGWSSHMTQPSWKCLVACPIQGGIGYHRVDPPKDHMPSCILFTFHLFFNLFIYLFVAALGLHCCAWTFSSCWERGLLSSFGLLVAEASRGGAQGLGCSDTVAVVPRFSCSMACGIFLDQRLDLCTPALADRFLTTGPSGKSFSYLLNQTEGRVEWPRGDDQLQHGKGWAEPFCVFRRPFPDPTPQGLCQTHRWHDSQKPDRVRMTQCQSQSGSKTFWVLFGDSHNS